MSIDCYHPEEIVKDAQDSLSARVRCNVHIRFSPPWRRQHPCPACDEELSIAHCVTGMVEVGCNNAGCPSEQAGYGHRSKTVDEAIHWLTVAVEAEEDRGYEPYYAGDDNDLTREEEERGL